MDNKTALETPIRVRFAPSPTGMMHLGNVRTALLNFLFAQQKQGEFILRIEDTDHARNYDPRAEGIIQDLAWLGIVYQEGPHKEKKCGPYFQSERNHIYTKRLHELIEKGSAYRCFCTTEELEQKRQRQLALKKPPRYDRSCLKKTQETVDQLLAAQTPFIWRFKLPATEKIAFFDMGRKTLEFALENFADFPLTRADGTFTFMFANAVDDIDMHMTTVIRGEDHLTNTVGQVLLYHAFNAPVPTFWHLPILCNAEGKKLSKRDFGFSLNDLRQGGFLAQAITNYLSIIGGSYEEELMTLGEQAERFHFDNIHTTGHIRYDVEKLKWLNHKWINRLSVEELYHAAYPFLINAMPELAHYTQEMLCSMLKLVQTDLITLLDAIPALAMIIKKPELSQELITAHCPEINIELFQSTIKEASNHIASAAELMQTLKEAGIKLGIPAKQLWPCVRLLLIGSSKGPHIADTITVIGHEEALSRLTQLIK